MCPAEHNIEVSAHKYLASVGGSTNSQVLLLPQSAVPLINGGRQICESSHCEKQPGVKRKGGE